MSSSQSVICIGGPTGCGKTALAIALAENLDAEIINADSRQVYAEFPIITAQPSAAERGKIPHHLYGYLNCSQKQSAGTWARLAKQEIDKIHKKNRAAILVGGTGFYFRAILTGLAQIPAVPEEISEHFQKRLEQEDSSLLHRELNKIDPRFAARIHPHDRQRIQRGLEVFAATGRPLTWWQQQASEKPLCQGSLFILNPQLNELTPYLESRIDKMAAAGALEEARQAKATYPDASLPGWTGIGCREILAYIDGQLTLEQCKNQWLKATRAYAKRQLTWFRGQHEATIITCATDILAAIDLSLS